MGNELPILHRWCSDWENTPGCPDHPTRRVRCRTRGSRTHPAVFVYRKVACSGAGLFQGDGGEAFWGFVGGVDDDADGFRRMGKAVSFRGTAFIIPGDHLLSRLRTTIGRDGLSF